MFNRASSKSSEHLPRIAQLVVPEAATDAAAGASAKYAGAPSPTAAGDDYYSDYCVVS